MTRSVDREPGKPNKPTLFEFSSRQVFGSTFMSALGGALSLYLGISIAMLIELAEFLMQLGGNLARYLATGQVPPADRYEAEEGEDAALDKRIKEKKRVKEKVMSLPAPAVPVEP